MWEIIASQIDFTDKIVLDLGCGNGDFLLLSNYFGATHAYGLEEDKEIVSVLNTRCKKQGISIRERNIEDCQWPMSDISFLFSVMPYLKDPDWVLRKMKTHSSVCLIECQYYNDGPENGWKSGLGAPIDDDNMEEWLKHCGFLNVSPLGWTEVPRRNVKRTIWMCS